MVGGNKRSGQSARGRLGGLATSMTHDTKALTAPARAAFDRRFESEVDPEGVLPAAERERRANAARRMYFAKLAMRSAAVRDKGQSR